VAAGGCAHHYFKVEGSLASDGGELGTWRSRPLGCSRDPVPPPQVGVYEDVATLLWDDGLSRDNWRLAHSPYQGNKPGRLELWRRKDGPEAGKIYGRMEMQKPVSAVTLDPSHCGILRLETGQGQRLIEGGRPTLKGTLVMDCQVGTSRVRGDLEFSGCEF
jgi:hypothetical protein